MRISANPVVILSRKWLRLKRDFHKLTRRMFLGIEELRRNVVFKHCSVSWLLVSVSVFLTNLPPFDIVYLNDVLIGTDTSQLLVEFGKVD